MICSSLNLFFMRFFSFFNRESTLYFGILIGGKVTTLTGNAIGGNEGNIDLVAKAVQSWRDNAGIDLTGRSLMANGDDFWKLLDPTTPPTKGQCAEGAILMEQAMELLGISAMYQHVWPADTLPVQTLDANHQTTTAPERIHGTHGKEVLWLWFDGQPYGWNAGEGCTLVNGKLYSAYAGGITGEILGNRTAAHDVLLQLAQGQPHMQRWKMTTNIWCYDELNGGIAPVPPVP
jgi:hypothetical protein